MIRLDISAVAEEVQEDFLVMAFGGLAAVAAIAVLAILLIRRHVLQPLRSIAANVSRGAASRKTGCDEGCSSTEVCQLAQALRRALVERDESQARLADANQQLEASNQRLGRLVESKDQFLASVSHELRTPLTAILGFARHLKDVDSALSSGERTAIIETICNEGADVGHLIEDLLTVARADIDRLDVASVRVDLLAQACQVVEGLAGKLSDVAVVGDQTLVLADPGRVRQIARNLLTNAARYGGSEVVVRVGRRDGHGMLWVIDDGPGIDDADVGRIFERYESAHERGRVADSVGIGLAVSRTLARLMSGDLAYERRDDRSVFELRLPVITQSSGEIEGRVAAQPDTVTAG
ncbi:MAG: HAMP domain-containing histidine kinase [bacterium]|nr:HAMP domain-containing histidine kinase [bacterium]